MAAERLAAHGVDLAWFTARERGADEVLPWDHLDAGLDRGWLWADWQDALATVEVDDCRWTPCYDCGVCPSQGTEIEVGPTGRTLLPLQPVGDGVVPGCASLVGVPEDLDDDLVGAGTAAGTGDTGR